MENIENKLLELQLVFDEIAFSDWVLSGLVAKEESAKGIYSTITKGRVILSEIENLTLVRTTEKKQYDKIEMEKKQYDKIETDEINKVQRRLKLWAKPERQNNINARILNTFLELKRYGNGVVTEKDIQNTLNPPKFKSNFDQMRNIAEKNHGKIFEQKMNHIEIWQPVRIFVSEYEQTTKTA